MKMGRTFFFFFSPWFCSSQPVAFDIYICFRHKALSVLLLELTLELHLWLPCWCIISHVTVHEQLKKIYVVINTVGNAT